MRDTLTKENFWNEMEQKYPKAVAHFKEWIDQYKAEHDWEDLFNEHDDGVLAMGIAPKYHDLPIAMQFGIFLEYMQNTEPLLKMPHFPYKVFLNLRGFTEDIGKKINRFFYCLEDKL